MNWQEGQHKVAAQKSTTSFFQKNKRVLLKKKVNYLSHSQNSRNDWVVERKTLIEKGFSTIGMKLIHVPGTWNVARYHVPGDYATCSTCTTCLSPWLSEL
jgi:hypothetical protein